MHFGNEENIERHGKKKNYRREEKVLLMHLRIQQKRGVKWLLSMHLRTSIVLLKRILIQNIARVTVS